MKLPRFSLPRFGPLGLRRELLILLPVAVLVLVLASTFTLLAYRSALQLLTEERQLEAAELARRLAEQLPDDARPTAAELRRLAPTARQVVLTDARGRPLPGSGPAVDPDPLAPLGGRRPAAAVAVGPGPALAGAVAGFAPLAGGRGYLRVDLGAAQLGRQLRGLRVLFWVVLGVNGGLTLLLLWFLGRLLGPWEELLAAARRSGQPDAGEDEVAFLISSVRRALADHGRTAGAGPGEDDIAVLQRALGSSLESGLLLLDRQGRVLALNRLGAEWLGVAAPAEPDRRQEPAPVERLLAAQPELSALLRRAVRQGRGVRRQEVTVRHPAGELTLGLSVHALTRDDGAVRGFLMLFADLTESRRQAEEKRLASSLDQLGELAAGVAHELRNSLATLRGYLTLIERRPEEEPITEYLAEIRRESAHLERVLEDFLAFARPGTARLEVVDLATAVRRAAGDPSLRGRAVDLRLDPAARYRIRGDRQLLERALRNLLHNAAEAQDQTAAEEPLEAAVERVGGELQVSVADRGDGVSAEVRRRLFQPFVTGRPGGVGLGLSLAHRIVTLHGGRLRLEDRPAGGTRAVITFPADRIV